MHVEVQVEVPLLLEDTACKRMEDSTMFVEVEVPLLAEGSAHRRLENVQMQAKPEEVHLQMMLEE